MFILIPGRHHLVTNFQFQYLFRFIHTGMKFEKDRQNRPLPTGEIRGIIFAVTSANHEGTRRNPIPYAMRAMAVQEFSHDLPVPVFCFPVVDVGNRPDFAAYTVKSIHHQADGIFQLSPDNCVVACSTEVGDLYRDLGYQVFGAESGQAPEKNVFNPWELIEMIADDPDWHGNPEILGAIHPASYKIIRQYNLDAKIRFLFSDPIASADGDITDTRDYSSYVRQMDENTHIKWNDVALYIKPGRIGDIGCATGSWLKFASEDPVLSESDFYGVELTRQLHDICNQRKSNGEFTNPNIWFSRKNAVSGLVFAQNSMNTIHSSSLTHEIESYGSHEELLRFIKNRFEELLPGGVWINRDVVGPEKKNRIVLMKLNAVDGLNTPEADLAACSTRQRFERFARDFRREEGYSLQYELKVVNDIEFISIRYEDASEFMLTKDYTDNWESEMHERFCFWSYNDWVTALEEAGFEVGKESRVFTNDWIAEHRFEGSVELFTPELEPIVYPPTTTILIARKPV